MSAEARCLVCGAEEQGVGYGHVDPNTGERIEVAADVYYRHGDGAVVTACGVHDSELVATAFVLNERLFTMHGAESEVRTFVERTAAAE